MRAERLSDRAVIHFYREAAHNDVSMTPMLRLVERLSRSESAGHFAAATSHDVLVISLLGDSRAETCVETSFRADHGAFHIRYWERGRAAVDHQARAETEAVKLITALLLRLQMTAWDH